MKLSNPKKVTKENVPSQYRDIVDSVGIPYNDFSDEVYNALTNNLTVTDNLNMQYKDIDLSVDSSGKPIISTQFKSALKTKTKGIVVIRVQNLTNTNSYPTGAPFVSFSENNSVITVNNITGLTPSNKYTITVLTLGS